MVCAIRRLNTKVNGTALPTPAIQKIQIGPVRIPAERTNIVKGTILRSAFLLAHSVELNDMVK